MQVLYYCQLLSNTKIYFTPKLQTRLTCNKKKHYETNSKMSQKMVKVLIMATNIRELDPGEKKNSLFSKCISNIIFFLNFR